MENYNNPIWNLAFRPGLGYAGHAESHRPAALRSPQFKSVPAQGVQNCHSPQCATLSSVQEPRSSVLVFGILKKVITPYLVALYSVRGSRLHSCYLSQPFNTSDEIRAASSQLALRVLQAGKNVTGQICSPASSTICVTVNINQRMEALEYLILPHDVGSIFSRRLWRANIC